MTLGPQYEEDRFDVNDQWGDNVPDDERPDWMEDPEALDENEGGTMYFEEAHTALNKLHQKTNKRGRMMRLPKRAESWR